MNFAKYTTVFHYKKKEHIFFFDFLFKGVRRTTFKDDLGLGGKRLVFCE